MVFLDDVTYREVKAIALGITHRDPLVNDFATWAESEYAIRIIDVRFRLLEPPSRYRYQLQVIIADNESYQKTRSLVWWEPNDRLLKEMASHFLELAGTHGGVEELPLADLWVACYDFSLEAMAEANWNATKELREDIRDHYPVVWHVMVMFESSVVFYLSDNDISVNMETGISELIANEYYSILKKHDDLGYFTRENVRLSFDSKENVDKNYAGSLFYYSRG